MCVCAHESVTRNLLSRAVVTGRQSPVFPQRRRGANRIRGTWALERRMGVAGGKPLAVGFLRWNPCLCLCHYFKCVGEGRHQNRKCQRDGDNEH